MEETPATKRSRRAGRGLLAGAVAAGLGAAFTKLVPSADVEVFARGAARIASWLVGSPMLRGGDGWLIPLGEVPVLVSAACSGTGFFLMVTALLAWHFAQRGRHWIWAVAGGLVVGFPLALVVNALRVVTLVQAHRWIIPRFPASYGPLLHMATGAAVFLSLLIGLNFLLEFHGKRPVSRRA